MPSTARCNWPTAIRRSRSRHHKAFLDPDAADPLLADDARWLRERLTAATACRRTQSRRTLGVLGNKPAMEARLAWYRARGAIRGPLGPIRVPTLYIWGDADDTVGRDGRRGDGRISSPPPIASKSSSDVGHFAAEQAPDRVNELLLSHLAAHPV